MARRGRSINEVWFYIHSAARAPSELTVEQGQLVAFHFHVRAHWALKSRTATVTSVYCFASWFAMAQLSFGIG